MKGLVYIRGGGDLASGIAYRLHRAGLRLVIAELPQPLVVRRRVSFAEAVFNGQTIVEGVTAQFVDGVNRAIAVLERGNIPVIVDPHAKTLSDFSPSVLIDGRMVKMPPELRMDAADLVIGLGPGFTAGLNCHAVIETNRGHRLGRVLWEGSAEPDTGVPEQVLEHQAERVLRAPQGGIVRGHAQIGDRLEPGQLVAEVDDQPVLAPFGGVLRGLIHPGIWVQKGSKVGDIDPRSKPSYCWLISDKSLAIAGGVLEAILSRGELRTRLWR